MTIRLDHTIVPARDKVAAARFFADVFGLQVKPGTGYFAQVQVNDSLTLDFADESEEAVQSHHLAFHVDDASFDAIWGRLKERGVPYGDGPGRRDNGHLYDRRGGRGLYFDDPNGHILEIMTVPETGS
jgi:catechol 2,3-dioxygenase-like lactoylglutathione lyase family enzyme